MRLLWLGKLAAFPLFLIPAARALGSPPEPDSLKIYVRQDRMYQVTGSQIESEGVDSGLLFTTEEVLGEEMIAATGAASNTDDDSADVGEVKGLFHAQSEVVQSRLEPGEANRGDYALKIVSDADDFSGVMPLTDPLLLLGGKRYRVSCSVFSHETVEDFRISVNSDLADRLWVQNLTGNSDRFTVEGGRWTELAGVITLPDIGDQSCWLWVLHWEKSPLTWYLDDLSFREVTKVRRARSPGTNSAVNPIHLAGLDPAKLNLYNQGRTVPILVEGLSDEGKLERDSTITFWGERPRDEANQKNYFTHENAYVLMFDSRDPPNRFMHVDSPPPDTRLFRRSRVTERHHKTRRIEKDSILQHYQYFDGPRTDRLMWTEFRSPPNTETKIALGPIDDLAEGATPISIRVSLWGTSHLPLNPDHDWTFRWNGKEIGRARWDGNSHYLLEAPFPPKSIRPGEPNVFSVINTHEESTIDAVTLDWIEIEYEAALRASGDFLEFTISGDQSSRPVRLAPSFSGRPVRIFNADHGIEVAPRLTVERKSGLVSAEYSYPFTGGLQRFRAVGPEGFAKPERMLRGFPSRLRQIADPPDYLILTHRDFVEALEPLVEQRERQGLTTLVVDVEDVYDEYSDGMFLPEAIRRFLDDLLEKSTEGSSGLRYVFLVGDATYDYFNIRGGSPNFVPTHHADEGGGLLPDYSPTYALDDYFVYGKPGKEGPEVPRVPVGRLPASRLEVVEGYVRKVLEYENSPGPDEAAPSLDSRRKAVLIGAVGYTEFCERLDGALLKDWQTQKVLASADQPELNVQLQHDIVDAINDGVSLVYFVGHGAYYMWRTGATALTHNTDMFTDAHIAQLSNRGKYPIVFTATCFSALFDAPLHHKSHVDSGVGIFMVEAIGKGAIALIAHVGKVTASGGDSFARKTMEELLEGDAQRLGDAFIAAKIQYSGTAFRGMALIGDPALYIGDSLRPPPPEPPVNPEAGF